MIKNIIFDLGGVLLPIDYQQTVQAFGRLGLAHPEQAFSKHAQAGVFRDFERGALGEDAFIGALKLEMPRASEQELIHAWNALLGEFPPRVMDFVEGLRDRYRLFILSNTNSIHVKAFESIIDQAVGWSRFQGAFDFIGYSHCLGARKPEQAIFTKILDLNQLIPDETCFIDDTREHVESARHLGIQAIHLNDGDQLETVLNKYLK